MKLKPKDYLNVIKTKNVARKAFETKSLVREHQLPGIKYQMYKIIKKASAVVTYN